MSIIEVARTQLQKTIEQNAIYARNLSQPHSTSEGWIKLMRQALGMSGAQLARKMGVTRALISKTEKVEVDGRVTLKKMQEFAEVMECEFVYCMIPRDNIQATLKKRAKKKAQLIVDRTNTHMGLEGQTLTNERSLN
jgi:predicted DNA-binding mobile mystery protein A